VIRGLLKRFSPATDMIAWVVGVTAALTAVTLLSSRAAKRTSRSSQEPASIPIAKKKEVRRDYFSIRKSHSELGFSYWVLQGHGCFASFALFDTWTEAIEAVNGRLLGSERDEQSNIARLQTNQV
jgi:hypothetical protein